MKTSILTLAIALAFSFTATPADAAPSEQDRCKRQVAKAERKHAGCVTGVAARSLRFGQQTGPQPAALSTCNTRRATALDRIGAKFPSLAPGDCGLDTASAAARAAAALVLAGLEEPIDNAAIAAAAAQAACEDANGTWDDSVCTPAAMPDRDCFREGACGTDGWRNDFTPYAGVTISSTGCSDTILGVETYEKGEEFYYYDGLLLRMLQDARVLKSMCEAD